MGDFLLCTAQYLLIMVVLAAIGGVGMFLGATIRKAKDKKDAAKAVEAQEAEQ